MPRSGTIPARLFPQVSLPQRSQGKCGAGGCRSGTIKGYSPSSPCPSAAKGNVGLGAAGWAQLWLPLGLCPSAHAEHLPRLRQLSPSGSSIHPS
uniref:Uncharacterized protein n=1 Tax=Geospiza parvula TaxID=87175 RepID=A0A8C3QEF8_GEOPR